MACQRHIGNEGLHRPLCPLNEGTEPAESRCRGKGGLGTHADTLDTVLMHPGAKQGIALDPDALSFVLVLYLLRKFSRALRLAMSEVEYTATGTNGGQYRVAEVCAMGIRTTTGRVPDDGRHDAFWKEEDLYRLQSEVG